jgi:hypothetical protein
MIGAGNPAGKEATSVESASIPPPTSHLLPARPAAAALFVLMNRCLSSPRFTASSCSFLLSPAYHVAAAMLNESFTRVEARLLAHAYQARAPPCAHTWLELARSHERSANASSCPETVLSALLATLRRKSTSDRIQRGHLPCAPNVALFLRHLALRRRTPIKQARASEALFSFVSLPV